MKLLSFSGRVFALAALALVLANTAAWGQIGTASIYGEVKDPKGLAVVGAKVTLTNVETQATRTGESDSTGVYLFPALPPGKYSLRVEIAGFRAYLRPNIELLVNTTLKANVQLLVGIVTETVQVTEVGAALNTTDASMGNVITPQQVGSLPLEARSPVALLTLQPGVVFSGDPTDQRSGSVNGGRSDQANVTLDGVDVNDQQTQNALTTALPIPLSTIQEFRFTTSNPNADQGRSSGGQVGFVTKSGTNEYHGSLFWTHRNTATTANDFFNNLSTPRVPVPKLLRNQFGGSFGGAAIKDRLFFFGVYEGNRRREERNAVRIVPTASLRDGALIYQCAPGSTCPGGTVGGLTRTHTVPAGFFGLTPANLRTIDPAGLGVNSAINSLMQNYPGCNDNSQGLDSGINFCGFRFNAPVALNNDVFVSRVDFNITRDARHSIFWRGTLGNLKRDFSEQQFPGQPVAQKFLDNSKGYVVSYTGQWLRNLTSVTRYGYTRQGNEFSGQVGAEFNIRSFDNLVSPLRATIRLIPTHNITEDLTWVRRSHTFQFGTNVRFIRNNRSSFARSFPRFSVNDGFCADLCAAVAESMGAPGPGALFPRVGNVQPFTRAIMGLYGIITTFGTAAFFDGKSNVLAAGQGTARKFVYNEYEFYGQDTWRMFRNFTLTFGLRYSYYGVPYEANGLQVTTTVDIMKWFESRRQAMLAGVPSGNIPLLSWGLAGQANNKPGYYRPDKNNFAPNVSFAWTPAFSSGWLGKVFGGPGKSVIRGGGRVVYDRIGGTFVVSQDQLGAVGLVSPLSNRTGLLNYSGPTCTTPPTSRCQAPRFSGLASLPNVANFVNVPAAGFPTTPPPTFSSEGFAVDNGLRTPYSYAFDLTYGRELPFNIALEVGYVARLGHSLLSKADLAAPLIYLVDPISKTNYAQAINALYDQSRPNINGRATAPTSAITPIPYFENMFSRIKSLVGDCPGLPGCSTTQRVYQFARGPFASFTDSLANLEGLADIAPDGFAFFQQQFDSLPTWTNLGRANYHALQVTLRKRFTQGLAFDFNYTYSKSIDNASVVENVLQFTGQIADAFFPNNQRVVSNFDLRHQMTANWVYELPFGRGKMLGRNIPTALDYIIGGWETSGIIRWRGAFPVGISNAFFFPTNFFLTGPGTLRCPISTNLVRNPTGSASTNALGAPNLFGNGADQDAAFACRDFTRSGSSGSRNAIRGVRFFNLDFGLRKSFKLAAERHKLVFDWQVFNLPNHPNFDDRTVSTDPRSRRTFGKFTGTIGADERNNNGRVMQFSLRYQF